MPKSLATPAGISLILLCYGCRNEDPRQGPSRLEPSAVAIPQVDVSNMQPLVAQRVTEAYVGLTAQPDSAEKWGRYGMVLDAHDVLAQALICYRQAAQRAPRDARWPYHLAILLDVQGVQGEEIVEQFETVASLAPQYPPVYFRMGEALLRLGRPQEARQAYEKALALDAAFALAHRGLGQALLTLNEQAAAVEHLEKAAELTPDDGAVQAALSQCYFRLGDRARGEAAAAKSRELQPNRTIPDPMRTEVYALGISSDICNERAKRRMAAGDFQGAIDDLKVVVSARPDSARAFLRLGACYLKTRQRPLAQESFEKAIALEDDMVEAHVHLATMMDADRKFDQAIAHYEKARQLAPEDANIQLKLAADYAQTGRLPAAIECWQRAAALGPLDAKSHLNWGTALMREGQITAALEHYDQAIALDAAYADAHFNRGLALEQLGRRGEALQAYRSAAALDPLSRAVPRLRQLVPTTGESHDGP